jgi:hypothetical protein
MPSHVMKTPQQQRPMDITARRPLAEGLVLVAAVLLVGAALIVVLRVIPPVRDVWVPRRLHAEGAVPAFWVSVIAHLVVAGVLVAVALRGGIQHRPVCWMLAVLGAGALVQALMFLDAVAAFYDAPGPLDHRVQSASDWLVGAIVTDVIAGLLVIVGTMVAMRGGPRSTSPG